MATMARVQDVAIEQGEALRAMTALVQALHVDESPEVVRAEEMHAVETIHCLGQQAATETAIRFLLRGWFGAAAADEASESFQDAPHATERV